MSNLDSVNAMLIKQMEVLSKGNFDTPSLQREVNKAKAMVDISEQVVKIAKLKVDAMSLLKDSGAGFSMKLPLQEVIGIDLVGNSSLTPPDPSKY